MFKLNETALSAYYYMYVNASKIDRNSLAYNDLTNSLTTASVFEWFLNQFFQYWSCVCDSVYLAILSPQFLLLLNTVIVCVIFLGVFYALLQIFVVIRGAYRFVCDLKDNLVSKIWKHLNAIWHDNVVTKLDENMDSYESAKDGGSIIGVTRPKFVVEIWDEDDNRKGFAARVNINNKDYILSAHHVFRDMIEKDRKFYMKGEKTSVHVKIPPISEKLVDIPFSVVLVDRILIPIESGLLDRMNVSVARIGEHREIPNTFIGEAGWLRKSDNRYEYNSGLCKINESNPDLIEHGISTEYGSSGHPIIHSGKIFGVHTNRGSDDRSKKDNYGYVANHIKLKLLYILDEPNRMARKQLESYDNLTKYREEDLIVKLPTGEYILQRSGKAEYFSDDEWISYMKSKNKYYGYEDDISDTYLITDDVASLECSKDKRCAPMVKVQRQLNELREALQKNDEIYDLLQSIKTKADIAIVKSNDIDESRYLETIPKSKNKKQKLLKVKKPKQSKLETIETVNYERYVTNRPMLHVNNMNNPRDSLFDDVQVFISGNLERPDLRKCEEGSFLNHTKFLNFSNSPLSPDQKMRFLDTMEKISQRGRFRMGDWFSKNHMLRCLSETNMNGSPGIPLNATYQTNRQLLEGTDGKTAYPKETLWSDIEEMKQSLLNGEWKETPIRVFVKQEFMKKKKINENKERLISSVGFVLNLFLRMFFHASVNTVMREVDHLPYKWAASQFNGGFDKLIRYVDDGSQFMSSTDCSAFDWSLPGWMIDLFADLHLRLCIDATDEYKIICKNLLKMLFTSPFCTSNGHVYKLKTPTNEPYYGVNRSGSYITIHINSITRVMMKVLAVMDQGKDFDDVKHRIMTCGDDSLERNHDLNITRMNEFYKKIGFRVDETKVSGILETDFCSRKIERDSIGRFIPIPMNTEKHACNLLWHEPKDGVAVEQLRSLAYEYGASYVDGRPGPFLTYVVDKLNKIDSKLAHSYEYYYNFVTGYETGNEKDTFLPEGSLIGTDNQ